MAQVQQHASVLASKLVRELHGEIVEQVCRHLLSKGLQTLPEVIRGTRLPPGQVRQALLVMVQQNYCAAYLHKEDEGVKNARQPYSLYEPRIDRMLHILRYPRFLLHIKEEMDDEAERIVEILLQMGRLTLQQLVAAVAGRLGVEPAEVSEKVRSVFMSLVQSRYIERAPPCTLPPPARLPHPASTKGRKSAAAKAGSSAAAAEQALALRSLEEITYGKARFKLPQDVMMGDPGVGIKAEGVDADGGGGAVGGEPAQPPKKKQRTKAGTKSTAKDSAAAIAGAPEPSAASVAAAAAVAAPSVLMWRVNTEEFNRRFRHRVCADMVADKIDADAGSVLTVMLAASRPYESTLREDRSSAVSADEATEVAARLSVRAAAGGDNGGGGSPVASAASVPTILSTIAHDALELISYIGDGPGGAQYVVNMGRIVQLVQLKQVESVIRDRFGGPGLRVFRLLLLKGQLEQKQVADFSMLPPKDTRELLYRMLRAGFLSLQDIPRTADRAPSRTLYTWRANPAEAGAQLCGELYAGAGRVWSRIRHEMAKEKELLDLIEESRVKGEMNFTLTPAQRTAAQRLKRSVDLLEASLLQLDEMIAIFNEY